MTINREVHKDYITFRNEGAKPEIAGLLCIASAIRANPINQIWRDPSTAAGWWRQLSKIMTNLDIADDEHIDSEELFMKNLEKEQKR